MSDTSCQTVIDEHQWVLDNWIGVMLEYESKFGERSVPGWECKHCGARLGTSGLPPRKCFTCGYDSSHTTKNGEGSSV